MCFVRICGHKTLQGTWLLSWFECNMYSYVIIINGFQFFGGIVLFFFWLVCVYLLHFGAKTCNLLNFAAEFLICTVHRFFPDLNQLFRGFHRVFHGLNWFFHCFHWFFMFSIDFSWCSSIFTWCSSIFPWCSSIFPWFQLIFPWFPSIFLHSMHLVKM